MWTALDVLAVAAATVGPAQPAQPVEFFWNAPDGCPSSESVTAAVEQLLSAPLDQPRLRRVSAIAAVRPLTDGRWEMRLYTVTPETTRNRVLVDESCELLAQATALVVAVAIDPTIAANSPYDHPGTALIGGDSPAPTTEPDPDPDPDPEPEPEPSPRPPRVQSEPNRPQKTPRPTLAIAASGGVSGGALPSVGGGAAVRASLLWARAQLDITAQAWPGRNVALRGQAGRVPVHQWAVGPTACGLPVASSLEVALCGGGEVGQVVARPQELRQSRNRAQPWIAATALLRVAWVFRRRWAVFASATVAVPLARAAFDVAGYGTAYRVGTAEGRGTLGLQFRLRGRSRAQPAAPDNSSPREHRTGQVLDTHQR